MRIGNELRDPDAVLASPYKAQRGIRV